VKLVIDNDRIIPYALGEASAVGGAERQMWLLARALTQRGHQVVIYSRHKQPRAEQVVQGVRLKWVSPRSPLVAWPKILRAEKPDAWWWFERDFYLGWLALLCRAYGTRLLFVLATDLDANPRRALSRRPYLWPLYALGLRLAHRILLLHGGQRGLLPPDLRRKARFWPSIAGEIQPAAQRGDYVAWVAVLREPKRPHLLAEIAARLPRVRFVVCGPTSLHRTSPAYAAALPGLLAACPNIDYRGQVPPAEAQQIISHAGLFLSTAAQEGLPNTFLQAWGAGVPVVSLELDPGGLVAQHSGGLVAHSLAECVEAIALLLRDQALNQRLGENGRRYVQACHSEENAVRALLDALADSDSQDA
jgi:glycosyltransferase involved in cell wall biosynthesis